MTVAIVIPARYASSRFPGKPLVRIAGRTLLERVWRIASAAEGSPQVLIATDDERIETHARSFGARVIMTDAACRNGSERVYDALKRLPGTYEVVINLQGDTPLTPPAVLNSLIDTMHRNREAQIATPAVRLDAVQHKAAIERIGKPVGGTYVVMDQAGRALYFSRFPIPFIRHDSKAPATLPFFKHLGIYAYRPDVLERLIKLPPAPLEELEQLEQLRALENGIPIQMVEVNLDGRSIASVDTPEDAKEVEQILAAEGDVV